MQDMKAAGGQLISDGDKAGQAFATGAADAIIEGPWKTADFKKVYGDKLGVAPIPAGPKGAAAPLTGVDGWYLNANLKGDKLTNAVNFALYMTSPKIEQYFIDLGGHIPADKTLKISDPITQGFAVAVATGYPRPQVAELDNFWGNFGDAYTKATDSGADAAASVKDACAKMNAANKK
jgi:arabinogalactan oligomer/maltooligosaccharide transport system substrate-binding protein